MVTTKNGVITTVYKKAHPAAPAKASIPVPPTVAVAAQSEPMEKLAQKLLVKAERYSSDDPRHRNSLWFINDYLNAEDSRALELFDKHFDAGAEAVHDALAVFRSAGLRLNNEKLFTKMVTFVGFAEDNVREAAIELLPMIRKHNDETLEEVAHCYNVLRVSGTPDRRNVSKMLTASKKHLVPLSPSLTRLSQSSTPVQDMRLIAGGSVSTL